MTLEKHNELIAISKLKVDQITNWRNNLLSDAVSIFNNTMAIEAIRQLDAGERRAENYPKISEWLCAFQEAHNYSSAVLLDKNLHCILGSRPVEPLRENGVKLAKQAMIEKKIIFSDLHLSSSLGPHLDLIIPLFISPKELRGFIGIVFLRIDAAKFLFPLLQSWPTVSRTSETLLVRREGNNVVYLNELRHQKNTALNMQFPLTDTLLPAIKAVLGATGIVEGTDYRGEKVLAYIEIIPDAPWYLITKVDTDEIFQHVRTQATWIFSLTLLLIVVGGLITYFLWRRHALKTEIERMVLLQHFDFLVKYANDVIILAEVNGNISQINDKATDIYGYSREELLELNLDNLCASEGKNHLLEILNLINLKEDGMIYETHHLRKNGQVFPVEISSRLIDVDGSRFYQAIIRDITERKMAEEQLRETTDYLENLFNFANAPIIVWDAALNITRFNHSFEQLTGRPAAEIIGKTLELFFPDDSCADSMEYFRQITAGKHLKVAEIPILHSDGSVKIVLWNSANILDKDGKTIVSTIAQGQDITERKAADSELIKNRRFLSDLIENSGTIIYAKDREGRYVLVNRKWEEVTNLSRAFAIGKTDEVLFPGSLGMQFYLVDQEALEAGTVIEKEEVLEDSSGTWYFISVKFPLLDENGLISGICVISTDITGRKEAEEEVKKLNTDLENRVITRTQQLENANKELEAFAYSVSHDLRAPLRGIDGWSLALLEDFGDNFNETARQYIERLRFETQRMGQLIDDMLKLSRVTRTEMKNENVALSELVQTIVKRLHEANPDRTIEFIVQPALNAVGDPQLLEIALTNLLDNAVKFTKIREVSRIEFGSCLIDEKPNYYIRDNGVGFDMHYAKKLFGAFQRLHKNTDYPGTGIGLATVQRIIHRHNGQIRAEAKVDEGTIFYFTIGDH